MRLEAEPFFVLRKFRGNLKGTHYPDEPSTDEEKAIVDILKPVGEMALSDLKEKAGLSGKKWDKSTKSLSKHGLLKVEKTADALLAKYTG